MDRCLALGLEQGQNLVTGQGGEQPESTNSPAQAGCVASASRCPLRLERWAASMVSAAGSMEGEEQPEAKN